MLWVLLLVGINWCNTYFDSSWVLACEFVSLGKLYSIIVFNLLVVLILFPVVIHSFCQQVLRESFKGKCFPFSFRFRGLLALFVVDEIELGEPLLYISLVHIIKIAVIKKITSFH